MFGSSKDCPGARGASQESEAETRTTTMEPGRVLRVEYIEVPHALVFHHDLSACFRPLAAAPANIDLMLLFLLTEQRGRRFERWAGNYGGLTPA